MGRLLRRYTELVLRNGTFTTDYYSDSNDRRIIHRFFEKEKGINTRSIVEDAEKCAKRILISMSR